MRNFKLNNWKIQYTHEVEQIETLTQEGLERSVKVQTVMNGRRNITNLVNLEKLEELILNEIY